MNRTKILVVEDEALVAEDLKRRLTSLGYQVPVFACSGEEAIELAARENPDLILMDIRLDGTMGGIEAATRILNYRNVPIIYLTAYSDQSSMDRTIETEPFAYLLKPFQDRELKISLEMALYKFQMEKRLRELQQNTALARKMDTLAKLAGGITHYLNNKITAIMGFTEVLSTRLGKESPILNELEQIQIAAGRAADMVRHISYFSEHRIWEQDFINLNNLIQKLSGGFQRVLGENISFTTSLNERLWTIKADPDALQEVLTHLILNAKEAIPENGKVVIQTQNVPHDSAEIVKLHIPKVDYVSLSIEDNGVGMSEMIKQHLFEPFYSTKGKGRGLGLATSYGIVHKGGGSIFVISELDRGAIFMLFFPRAEEAARACSANKEKMIAAAATIQ